MCRFKPINTSLYLCDNKFHTEALDELLVTMKRRDRAFAVLDQGQSLKIAKDQLRPISPLRVRQG